MLYFWDDIGDAMTGALFPPDGTIRGVSSDQRIQFFFCKSNQKMFLSSLSAINPDRWRICRCGCSSGTLFYLHTGSLVLPLLLGNQPYRSAGCAKLLPSKNDGGHCAPGTELFDLDGFVFALISTASIKRCVSFQIISIQLN